MLEWGRANLFPFSPDARSNAPMLAACPMHIVDIFGLIYWMVSYIARPAVTLPPGEFM